MKTTITTVLTCLMLTSTTWALCPETNLTKKIKKINFTGKIKVTAMSTGDSTYLYLLENASGSEIYEDIRSKLSDDYSLLSSVYVDKIDPAAYFFVQDKKSCMNSVVITPGDGESFCLINGIHGNAIDCTEQDSKTHIVFEKMK